MIPGLMRFVPQETRERRLVAVGSGGTIITSDDQGATWDARTSGTSNQLNAVCHSGSLYVAVGIAGTIVTSPDGETWNVETSGTSLILNGVAWNGSVFCVVTAQGNTAFTSPDGATWTSRSTPSATGPMQAITANGSLFVAVGNDGSGGGRCITSTDGITWSYPGIGVRGEGVVFGGGLYVSVGTSGGVATSPDAATWTNRSSGTSFGFIDICWTGSQFIAPLTLGLRTSPDGITWTGRSFSGTPSIYGVVWAGSQLVAVGGKTSPNEAAIQLSADGITWTANNPGLSSMTLYGIC